MGSWAPSLAPCPPHRGCQEGMIQAELGEALGTWHSLCQCLFMQKTCSEPGILSPSRNAKPGQGGCVPRSLEWQAEWAPLGGGTPGDPVGLCQSLSHPRHCVHRVCKREVSPGDSWAWVLDGAFREQMGASQSSAGLGSPGTYLRAGEQPGGRM